MMQWHSLSRLGVRPWAMCCGGLALLAVGSSAPGASIPAFSPAASSLSGIHDGDGVYTKSPNPNTYDFGSSMPLPAGSATLLSPFAGAGHSLSGVISGNAWSSTARGGAGHVEASNSARITFPSGMGVDQTDPGHVQSGSTYEMDFDFSWTATGSMSPLGSTFSIPIGASVPAGGSASFSAHIHWDLIASGTPYSDARAKFFPSYTFPVGVTATSFTAPAAAFAVPSLTTGDVIRIYGFLLFTADNDTAPVDIETFGDAANPPKSQELANYWSQHPEFQFEAFASTDDVVIDSTPEPSSLVCLAIAAAGLLGRRRGARSASNQIGRM